MADLDLRNAHADLMTKINEIDEQLDSLDGDTATKTKVVNDLVSSNETIWSPVVTHLVDQLNNLDEETLAGVFNGIVKTLRKEYEEKVKGIVSARVEAAPKVEPLITEEQAKELQELRSGLYQQVKMAVTLFETMTGEKLPMPKTRRGSKGKRGKRALTLMVWSIDGEELDPQPKTKELAEMFGFEKSSEFTAYLKSKDVDTTNPKDGEISVTMPDGRTLDGYIPSDDDDDENGDEDSDD